MQTHIDLKFADGEYTFKLGLAQVHELQNACNGDGIGLIYARVLQGRMSDDISLGLPHHAAYKQGDLTHTVRLGLIGGGKGVVDGQSVEVDSIRANELIESYFHELPISDQWTMAAAILFAKIEGYKPPDGTPKADKKKVTPETKSSA